MRGSRRAVSKGKMCAGAGRAWTSEGTIEVGRRPSPGQGRSGNPACSPSASSGRVHASTISRTLSAARLKLHEETRQRLTERLGLTTSQVASLVGLVLSRLELNLASALGRRR
ncbi:MAG TPA: hypothetical protein VMK42_05020 [Anaeromyxobacteraceae bacterium]|nr:hypothetical protein [Anaeromyxobacteraceae bacterium]